MRDCTQGIRYKVKKDDEGWVEEHSFAKEILKYAKEGSFVIEDICEVGGATVENIP